MAQNSIRVKVILLNRVEKFLGGFTVLGEVFKFQVLNDIGKSGIFAL